LYVLELDEDGEQVIGEEQYFNNWWGRLRDVCMAPDGAIYLATNGPDWGNSDPFTHSIIKLWNPDYVSIEEPKNNDTNLMRIFPNPAKDYLNVSISGDRIGQQIKIYSSDGKLVLQQLLDHTTIHLPLKSLGPGLFLISIEKDRKLLFSKKFFIQKY